MNGWGRETLHLSHNSYISLSFNLNTFSFPRSYLLRFWRSLYYFFLLSFAYFFPLELLCLFWLSYTPTYPQSTFQLLLNHFFLSNYVLFLTKKIGIQFDMLFSKNYLLICREARESWFACLSLLFTFCSVLRQNEVNK